MMTDFNLIPLLPEIFMAFTGMVLLMVGVLQGNDSTRIVSWFTVLAFMLTLVLVLGLDWNKQAVLGGMFMFDQFAGFMKILVLLGLGVSLAISVRYLIQEQLERFEYPVLTLFAGLGMMLMLSAGSLLTLYMALELQSLSLYVLAAFRRNSLKSAEAGAKYFILGALSSGMILFGISLIYGFTGSVDYGVIHDALAATAEPNLGAVVGLVFLLAGIAFKISAAPFHMWTPDVYQGAPTSVTALFAIVPKVAAIGVLMRLVFEPFAPLMEQSGQILYFLAAASLLVGAFAAIPQTNIKRLMAYSSIGNMGYALIGLVAGSQAGAGAVVLYMIIYLIMTAGVFTIILTMRRGGLAVDKISDLSGLSQTHPALAYAMAVLMFSMAGIPPMAGFFGKLAIFQAAVASGVVYLAVLGVLASVVAAYYYLKIVKVMFFDEPLEAYDGAIPFARRAVMLISVLFVIGFVLKPNFLFDSARSAASVLFPG
ncbi:MAG TPA: NADH-quinone oxidoreductase subunit NuoN [Alphaproteobacteria bacterium]|nr:NADH-quinone oxidoreductase subunit NuoN [Alphaproteobacteria bacterium]